MRILLRCVLFVLIVAALLLGLALETSGSIRTVWTWIPAVVGAAIFEGITYVIFRAKPKSTITPADHTIGSPRSR